MPMRVDQKPVNRSIRNLTSYLEGIDPNKRRVERLLDILAMIAGLIGFILLVSWFFNLVKKAVYMYAGLKNS